MCNTRITFITLQVNFVAQEDAGLCADSVLYWNQGASTGNYIAVPIDEVLESSSSQNTVCLWARATDADNGIISWANDQGDNTILWYYSGSSWLPHYFQDSYSTGLDINDNVWRHLCATWNSDGGYLTTYLNGEQLNQWSGVGSGRVMNNNGLMTIGQEQDCPPGCWDAS